MAVNPLPPQAYTKETLQKAYTWLLTQSPSIKEMASSQDILISLYLKAQRNGEASLETPSIQNFKQELKSLAGIMGDLQPANPPSVAPSAQMTMPHPAQHLAPSASHAAVQKSMTPSGSIPSMNQIPNSAGSSAPLTGMALMGSSHAAAGTSTASQGLVGSLLSSLDAGSLQALAEVRQSLNLSSDAEALRALIALGHKQFKKVYSN